MAITMSLPHLQRRVGTWIRTCLGDRLLYDRHERARRVLEEALELAQVEGVTVAEVRKLHDYVYSRPVGEAEQEVAGVAVTLFGYGAAASIDIEEALLREIERIESPETMERIRRKQIAKEAAGVGRAPGASDP